MIGFRRERGARLDVTAGERSLAAAPAVTEAGDDVVIGGSAIAAYLPQRVEWQRIASATWDSETDTLTVVEMADWGEVPGRHRFTMDEPATVLDLFRERITASMVWQRHVPLRGKKGVRVIARKSLHRAATGDDIAWFVEYDAGIDPADEKVSAAVDGALGWAAREIS